ncbi:MAG: hypothetical protein AAGD96_04385 [Chloroflexota bacterium]
MDTSDKKFNWVNMYLRVIANDQETHDLERDGPIIQQLLMDANGVSSVQPIETHIRGGYKLFFECPADKLDELVDRLVKAGFRPCY